MGSIIPLPLVSCLLTRTRARRDLVVLSGCRGGRAPTSGFACPLSQAGLQLLLLQSGHDGSKLLLVSTLSCALGLLRALLNLDRQKLLAQSFRTQK